MWQPCSVCLHYPPRHIYHPGAKVSDLRQMMREGMKTAGFAACTICREWGGVRVPAIARFAMDEGCACSDNTIQDLCPQHIVTAEPEGSMEFVAILVPDPERVIAGWLAGRNPAWTVA